MPDFQTQFPQWNKPMYPELQGQGQSDSSGTPSTGDANYDQILAELNDYLNKLKAAGQTINPNVQITPDKIAEFTNQAVQQIHPYYATQLKSATDQFLKSQGFSAQDLAASEQKAQRDYGQGLRDIASSSAEKGFAQSGIRTLDEQNLATNTQASLDSNRRLIGQNSNTAAGNFANRFGFQGLPQSPNIGAAPRVLAGNPNFDTSGENQSLYQLSPSVYEGLIGSDQNAEKSATSALTRNLTTDYTTQQANAQTRALNI